MNETKAKAGFTPGPYSISGIAGDGHIMAPYKEHHRRAVAVVTGWPGIAPEEHEANKALLAAAPAMYEALKRCKALAYSIADSGSDRNIGPDIDQILEESTQAMALAEGQS